MNVDRGVLPGYFGICLGAGLIGAQFGFVVSLGVVSVVLGAVAVVVATMRRSTGVGGPDERREPGLG